LLQYDAAALIDFPFPGGSIMLKASFKIVLYSFAAVSVGVPLFAVAFVGLALIGF
jgi:hypothetical protein